MCIKKFEHIEVEKETTRIKNKPRISDTKTYPYQLMDPGHFEMLLYHIFRQDIIEEGCYSVINGEIQFDNVSLMQLSKDKGRDCSLTLNGKAVGLIQCKRLGEDIRKPIMAKEIIKFILFYLVGNKNKDLIHDINNFTYYFAVAKNFKSDASDLIDNFNEKILEEADLKSWTNSVIRGYETFKEMNYDYIKKDLKEILSRIKVRKIISADLSSELEKYKQIVSLFFDVRIVHVYDIPYEDVFHKIYEKIDEWQIKSKDVKKYIIHKVEEILEIFQSFGDIEFKKFIKAITTPIPERKFSNRGKINYQENINVIANVVIHIALLSLIYSSIEFNTEIGKGLKIDEDEYLTYFYSRKNESYENVILNLIRYIYKSHQDVSKIKNILVGSTLVPKCNEIGASFDLDGIIYEITHVDPMKNSDEFMRLRDQYEFNYHCSSCLEFERIDSLKNITLKLQNILEGDKCVAIGNV